MKEEVSIAICVSLVDNMLLDVEKAMKYLKKKDMRFLKNRQSTPHITLCTGQINVKDLDLVISKLKKNLSSFNSFKIETNGLGLFIKDNINLHIRWSKSNKMLKLKDYVEKTLNNIWKEDIENNNKFNWVAKTSLAYKDINYTNLSKINFSKIDFRYKKMCVEKISIIKFELNKKERTLKSIKLKGVNK
jgi:2'-5' RNA ligase